MADVTSTDPRTNLAVEVVAEETTLDELQSVCAAASAAGAALGGLAPRDRAALLEAMASGLDAARGVLVPLADRESALGEQRLDGELTRTVTQLRLFADVLRDGGFLEAIIDRASGTTPGIRRMLVPLGPVAVFGASNFPFAFSAAGGDTASALAAGCPVVVKAHGAHPALDTAVVEILRGVAERQGLSEDVVSIVYGRQAAQALVSHPLIRAVGFTGSEAVGRMLMDLAAARESPIPVYAEMGSLNPLVITPAAAARPDLAATVADSILLGAGQFCTKPGIVFVPVGVVGDRLVSAMTERLASREPSFLLSVGIRDAFVGNVRKLAERAETRTLVGPAVGEGSAVSAALVEAPADALGPESPLLIECFGPGSLVVRYGSSAALRDALLAVPPSLTLSLFAEPAERDVIDSVLAVANQQVGRVIFDGVPTGVAVSWSQNHSGPYPASSGGGMFTSVGATALRRFQRPIAYQGLPDDLLPDALRDGNPLGIPRRVDGTREEAAL